jgi:hypothetical protein
MLVSVVHGWPLGQAENWTRRSGMQPRLVWFCFIAESIHFVEGFIGALRLAKVRKPFLILLLLGSALEVLLSAIRWRFLNGCLDGAGGTGRK